MSADGGPSAAAEGCAEEAGGDVWDIRRASPNAAVGANASGAPATGAYGRPPPRQWPVAASNDVVEEEEDDGNVSASEMLDSYVREYDEV